MISAPDFAAVFNPLAVALREREDETGVTQETYYAGLSDLSLEALRGGAEALVRERGRRFFPTVPEWRDAALVAAREELRKALPPVRDEPWQNECGACLDTGWELHRCPGGMRESIALCGRRTQHAEHDYVQVCTCRPHNRTYQRHQEFGHGAGATR